MHTSSLLKIEAFLSTYAGKESAGRRVLDVGSATYGRHVTYRQPCVKHGLEYVGLDMQPGENVDIATARPFVYTEVGDEEFDFIISGQAFEHNPYFWVSFCEMARVLKPGGHMMIVAPSAGSVHRYPFDCWRYYPDSWSALCALTGLEQLETIFEPPENKTLVDGVKWRDSAIVARKRPFASAEDRNAFYENLRELTAPFHRSNFDFVPAEVNRGPVFHEYQRRVRARRPAASVVSGA